MEKFYDNTGSDLVLITHNETNFRAILGQAHDDSKNTEKFMFYYLVGIPFHLAILILLSIMSVGSVDRKLLFCL